MTLFSIGTDNHKKDTITVNRSRGKLNHKFSSYDDRIANNVQNTQQVSSRRQQLIVSRISTTSDRSKTVDDLLSYGDSPDVIYIPLCKQSKALSLSTFNLQFGTEKVDSSADIHNDLYAHYIIPLKLNTKETIVCTKIIMRTFSSSNFKYHDLWSYRYKPIR